jgi:hypothetical protein
MAESFLVQFKHSYTIIVPIIIFALLFTFIDSKITGKPHTTTSYLKVTIGSALLSFFVVYVNTLHGVVSEEILTGNPPF